MKEATEITIVQPALPFYRLDFFERLAAHYKEKFRVIHAADDLGELTKFPDPAWAQRSGALRQIGLGLEWQSRIAGLPVGHGEIIVLSGNPRQLSTLALLVRARMSGATVIWWGHLWSGTSRRWRQALRFLPMRLAHGLLFYTEDEAAGFRERPPFPLGARAVFGLENGIDTGPIIALRTPFAAGRRRHACLFLGRLTVKANLALALRALAAIGNHAPDLHIIGDGPERAALERLADELGVGRRLHWHGAIVDEARIAEIANSCRAFLYPGSVGLSLIHAMAYGLPCIVHDAAARHMPEIAAFRDGETGLSYKHESESALAEAMKVLLADESRLDSMSAACLARTSQAFNTRDMAQRFVSMVDELAGGAVRVGNAGTIPW